MGARQHILIMRHPETIANARHVLSGRKDVDLTPRGERQMYQAIDAIEAWKPDRIWTSPLSRCKSIAEEAASRLKVPCRVEDGLQEMEFGSAQDLTISELSKRGLHFPWSFDGQGHSVTAPGAESFETLLARAKGVLDRLFPLQDRLRHPWGSLPRASGCRPRRARKDVLEHEDCQRELAAAQL